MRRLAVALHLAVAACNPPLGGESSDASATTASSTSEGPGPPPIPCDGDEDCAHRCHEGQCVQGCSPELPCASGLECVEDACIAPIPRPPACPMTVTTEPFLELALPGGSAAHMVGAADVDGDGTPELFAGRSGLWLTRLDGKPSIKIFAGTMEGAFETNIGDIDGDGHLDILPNTGHEVLFGDGAGNFQESPGPDPALADGALGDLDGDGRADIVGFMFECPLDAPPETECWGYTPARWLRSEDSWVRIVQGMVFGEPRNVLVAPLLAGHTPVGVYESATGWIILGTFTPQSWPVETYRVRHDDELGYSEMVAVQRDGDDRAELARVVVRKNQWTWGARIRSLGEYADILDRWALPGQYRKIAAGDVDQDGNDDLVLAGPNLLLLLDREEEPTGSCAIEISPDAASDVALADLDGDGIPELILGAAPGIVVLTLKLSS